MKSLKMYYVQFPQSFQFNSQKFYLLCEVLVNTITRLVANTVTAANYSSSEAHQLILGKCQFNKILNQLE